MVQRKIQLGVKMEVSWLTGLKHGFSTLFVLKIVEYFSSLLLLFSLYPAQVCTREGSRQVLQVWLPTHDAGILPVSMPTQVPLRLSDWGGRGSLQGLGSLANMKKKNAYTHWVLRLLRLVGKTSVMIHAPRFSWLWIKLTVKIMCIVFVLFHKHYANMVPTHVLLQKHFGKKNILWLKYQFSDKL